MNTNPHQQWQAWLEAAASLAAAAQRPIDAQDMKKRFRRGLSPHQAVAELLQETRKP